MRDADVDRVSIKAVKRAADEAEFVVRKLTKNARRIVRQRGEENHNLKGHKHYLQKG